MFVSNFRKTIDKFGPVHRQQGQRANLLTGLSRKQSTPNFPRNEHFLPPDTHTYVCVSGRCVSGGKKCSFFEQFGVFCFIETPVLRFPLLPYYRRVINAKTPFSSVFKSCVRHICARLYLSLSESTCETRKNVFCFTSKTLFVLEKIKF